MTAIITEDQYEKFVIGLKNGLPSNAKERLIKLGFKNNVYNDPWVIEIAVLATPIRFSFKFKKNDPLCCCINLRPYSISLGEETRTEKDKFDLWIEESYGATTKASNTAPYFKPFGHTPKNGRTIDAYFELSNNINITNSAHLKSCPEFPTLAASDIKTLTLIEAVNCIFQRL